MDILLEGKTLSNLILNPLPERINSIKQKINAVPTLAIINYQGDPSSAIYVKRKISTCEKLGIAVRLIAPQGNCNYEEFLKILREMDENSQIHAIMIERPLPGGFEIMRTWENIPAEKDVDGLSAMNMGKLFICKTFSEVENGDFFAPCTAMAVIKLLNHYRVEVPGKRICVIGRSSVVGKPLAHLLTCMNGTVTLCHSKTTDISLITKSSDIIISAIGRPKWLKQEMMPKDSVVIDVGTNFDESGKMCGDVDFENVQNHVRAITPVPGGVGPVTLGCLIENSVKAAEKLAQKLR
jgi:methylenetetrahydrofolate dehydrogenase (NADP+)/methenyltetrahydrofolate cyclohydrolase